MFPTGCLFGECSLLSSFAPMIPTRSKQYFELGRTRQIEKLFEMQKEYITMVEDVIAPLRRRELMDGAYDKVLVQTGRIAYASSPALTLRNVCRGSIRRVPYYF